MVKDQEENLAKEQGNCVDLNAIHEDVRTHVALVQGTHTILGMVKIAQSVDKANEIALELSKATLASQNRLQRKGRLMSRSF